MECDVAVQGACVCSLLVLWRTGFFDTWLFSRGMTLGSAENKKPDVARRRARTPRRGASSDGAEEKKPDVVRSHARKPRRSRRRGVEAGAQSFLTDERLEVAEEQAFDQDRGEDGLRQGAARPTFEEETTRPASPRTKASAKTGEVAAESAAQFLFEHPRLPLTAAALGVRWVLRSTVLEEEILEDYPSTLDGPRKRSRSLPDVRQEW